MRNVVVMFSVLLALLSVPSQSFAWFRVCQVIYSPETRYGVDGGLWFQLADSGSCTTAGVTHFYGQLCSINATDANCISNTQYRYKLQALLQYLDFMYTAQLQSTRLTYTSGACFPGSSYQSCFATLGTAYP